MINPISLLKPLFSRTNSEKVAHDLPNILDQTSKSEVKNKWNKKRPFYLRILDHRGKIILLPLLGLFIPSNNTNTTLEPQTDNIIAERIEEIQNSKETSNNQNSDYFNRVKLSILASVALLLLIKGSDRLLRSKQRTATHEIGHLLAFCATQSEIKSTSVAMGYLPHQNPHFYNDWKIASGKLKDLSMKEVAQYLIMVKGADSLEKLRYKFIDITPSWLDKTAFGYLTTIAGIDILRNKPGAIREFLKFVSKVDRITTTLLQQIDPKVVEQLIEKLLEDWEWDEEKIRELIREYKLDQLPPFDEMSDEVKQFLNAVQ